MTTLIAELVSALEENLPAMPPKDAMCHVGICSQEECAHCGRVARGYAAIKRAKLPSPEGDVWRVDVAGYSCYVKGEHAKDHLERVNQQLARMKMALHQISHRHPNEGTTGDIARQALENV